MRGLWLENGRIEHRDDLPTPEPAGGEALIRVRLAGVCGTDLHLSRGYYDYRGVPGHEFVGEVVESEDPAWRGQRVVGEINAVCGACPACRAGRATHCERRTVLGIKNRGGAFAEFLTLPLSNLHQVADSVADEAAVFTEPLAAALQIQQQVRIGPSDRVLLVGAGRLGQLIARVLALAGCRLRVAARRRRQRELLREAGISVIREGDVTPGWADVAIEAAGSPEGFRLARKAVRPAGTIVLKSTFSGEAQVDLSSLVVDEISVTGSRCGPFAPALRLLEAGLVNPVPLVDGMHPLEDGPEAFAEAARPGILKVLLNCSVSGSGA